MSPGKWKPRRFSTPKSPREFRASPERIGEILKDLWPCTHQRPWWAKLAYQRRWMTHEQYYSVPLTEKCEELYDLLYEESPLLVMLKKELDPIRVSGIRYQT